MDDTHFFRRDRIADRGVSALLSVLNRADCIETVLGKVVATLDRSRRGFEIIVVDRGSSDQTPDIVAKLAESNSRVRLVRSDHAIGFGEALRVGIEAAKYPMLLQMECEHDPESVHALFGRIDQVDMVCGYRQRPRDGLSGWLYRRLVRMLFGVALRDVDCGCNLYRRAVLKRIPIQSTGRFAQAEIFAKANFMNMLMTETPVVTDASSRESPPADPWLRDLLAVFRRPQFTSSSPTGSGRSTAPRAA